MKGASMTEQSTEDIRPTCRDELALLVSDEADRRIQAAGPQTDAEKASLTKYAAIDVAWAEIKRLTEERDTLRVGIESVAAEIDDMPCLHGLCPGMVELSPKPRCSLCHTRMALRALLSGEQEQDR